MTKIKIPSYNDAHKSLDIRKRSKRGIQISQEEQKFNYEIMRKYYAWAQATEAQVFNETIPFGSDATRDAIKFQYQETESTYVLPDKPKGEGT